MAGFQLGEVTLDELSPILREYINKIDTKADKTIANEMFGVKNPNYKGDIDELFKAGQYILQSPFSGTLPSGQNTGTAQWSILNVYGGGDATSMIYQDLTTTNHTAYGAYANRYYRRIRFGNTWGDWKEIATTVNTNDVYTKSMNVKGVVDNANLFASTGTGIYLTPASGVTDLPDGWAQGRHTLVTFNPNNDLYGFQLITTYAGNSGLGINRKFAIRHAMTEGSAWKEIGLVTRLESPTLLNGWTYGTSVSTQTITRCGDAVTMSIALQGNSSTQPILTLPTEFRPKKLVVVVGQHYETEKSCNVVIEATGIVRSSSYNPFPTTGNVIINATWSI